MKSLDTFPRLSLGLFPTPIHRLDNISATLGANVYIKRDDLTGLGLGGNKTRKLEFLLADAKQKGAELVFTTGGAQSNHAMLTAAAAGRLGMRCILILKKRGRRKRRGPDLRYSMANRPPAPPEWRNKTLSSGRNAPSRAISTRPAKALPV